MSGDTFPSVEPITIENMTTRINGRVITGKNICMRNGVLFVDGKVYDPPTRRTRPRKKKGALRLSRL